MFLVLVEDGGGEDDDDDDANVVLLVLLLKRPDNIMSVVAGVSLSVWNRCSCDWTAWYSFSN